jgi:hypothetical protein
VDPQEKLGALHKELMALWEVYATTPLFGIAVSKDARPSGGDEGGGSSKPMAREMDGLHIVDHVSSNAHLDTEAVSAAYLASDRGAGGSGKRRIVCRYCALHVTPRHLFCSLVIHLIIHSLTLNCTTGITGTTADDDTLGLAVEAPPAGVTLQQLWAIGGAVVGPSVTGDDVGRSMS